MRYLTESEFVLTLRLQGSSQATRNALLSREFYGVGQRSAHQSDVQKCDGIHFALKTICIVLKARLLIKLGKLLKTAVCQQSKRYTFI